MKILAVDDDENITDLLQASVTTETKHTLLTAASGPEAIRTIAAQREPFDCFLLDIQMPVMSGITLCQKIRKTPGYSRTPIIMLTAMSQKKYVDQAFAAGATDYVTKPFDFLELFSRIGIAEKLTGEQERANLSDHAVAELKSDLEKSYAINVNEPVEITGVDNVVGYVAFENYVMQLSRMKLMRSHVFAVKIVNAESLHRNISSLAFRQMLKEIAMVLVRIVGGTDSMVTYRGGGIFLCTTSTKVPHSHSDFELLLNTELAETSVPRFKNQTIMVAVGDAVSLMSLTRAGAMFSLTTAANSAETRAAVSKRNLNDVRRVLRANKRSNMDNIMERRAYEVLFDDIKSDDTSSLKWGMRKLGIGQSH